MFTTNLLPPYSSSLDKLLPPYPTSEAAKVSMAREKLIAAIAQLESCNQGTILMLLSAISQSILYSEESYQRFADTGWLAAIELYDTATQNSEFEAVQVDPNNPRNWSGYAEWQKPQTP